MQEIFIVLAVVVPDDPNAGEDLIRNLRGRELHGVPGSWISRVAIHHPPSAVTGEPHGPIRVFDGGELGSEPDPYDTEPGDTDPTDADSRDY